MRKLRGRHILIATSKEERSRPTIITFKKVTRAGRNPQYKKIKIPQPLQESSPPPSLQPAFQPSTDLADENIHDTSIIEIPDEDIPLPRYIAVSTTMDEAMVFLMNLFLDSS